MIEPRRALVRPRVLSPITGEALLLEDVVADEVRRGCGLPIRIVGGSGSGKTTALCHLQAVLSESPELPGVEFVFLDEPIFIEQVAAHLPKIVVATTKDPFFLRDDWQAIRLAPWGEDDVLEYLLARHKTRCGEVLAQLQSCDRSELEGIPELWTLALDALAENRAQPPLSQVLRTAIFEKSGDAAIGALGLGGLLCVLKDEIGAEKPSPQLGGHEVADEVHSLLRHVPMQHALAVGRIADDLAGGSPCHYLIAPLPRSVVCAVAERIRDDPAAAAHIRHLLTQSESRLHPMAASICHRLDRQWLAKYPTTQTQFVPSWQPIFPTTVTTLPNLAGAYLDHADWPDLKLPKAILSKADLSFANLAGTNLADASASGTNFHGATLTKAELRRINAGGADFSGADLRGANGPNANFALADLREARFGDATFFEGRFEGADFTGASLTLVRIQEAIFHGATFADADLTGANFASSNLSGNDFRTARLDRSCWSGAKLAECNFEEVAAERLEFDGADLTGSLWTGSALTEATFAHANLTNAGLAEIEWEGADLRDADLRGASFHLGSSRSGLVGSPIAREGSMTGFYTDDFAEQEFKSPEEIRKADLRGADLRGANIEGVDFYLVDLRDAKYDETQAAHFRACRAILQTRGE